MEFRCRLASATGEVIEGTYAAENEARLRHDFEARGLHVLALRPKGSIGGVSLQLPQRTAIPASEFLVFNQQLATLLKAGMPLVQSLDLLKRQMESPVLRGVLEDVHEKVRSGTALSDAFGAHEALVPTVYTASVLAGERSGSLDAVLRRYVDYSRILAALKRKTLSALIYPAILVTLSLVVVGIIVLWVVPEFEDFYVSFGTTGTDLPFFTQVIVNTSAFIREQSLLIVALLIAAVVFTVTWMRRAGNRARIHHALLRLPMLGEVAKKFSTAQMARTLATLLGGGLPLVNALDISAKAVGNQYMADQLGIVSSRVREGESFAAALQARRVFPDVAVRMVEVGESTGALQDMLNTVADFYDDDVSTRMERFVTIMEPSLLVIMGIVIASLLIALYMPLLQMSAVVGG